MISLTNRDLIISLNYRDLFISLNHRDLFISLNHRDLITLSAAVIFPKLVFLSCICIMYS